MRFLRIDDNSPYQRLVGVGGMGSGIFFRLEGDHTLGRNESRSGHLLEARDYCKLHIVIYYVAKLLNATPAGNPFHVLPVGKVGADMPGQQVVAHMDKVGIDTSHIEVLPHNPTLFSVCFQYPDATGGNITTSNSAAGELSNADIDGLAPLFRSQGPSIMALAVPEVPLDVRHRFLHLAHESGSFCAASFVAAEIDPALRAGIFSLLDLVALNHGEAEQFVGISFDPADPKAFIKACQQKIRTSYPKLKLVVSAGKYGAYGLTINAANFCPAPVVEVQSTAGAGDSLLGGVLAGIASGLPFVCPPDGLRTKSIQTALDLAVCLASYKCQSVHTINECASLDSLIDFARASGIPISSTLDPYIVEREGRS